MNWRRQCCERATTERRTPVGRRLAVLRRQKGLSQKELAERLDTTQKTADYYERRALNSTLDLVERVAAALKVPAAEIIGDGVAPTRLSKKAGPTGKVQKVFEDVSRTASATRKNCGVCFRFRPSVRAGAALKKLLSL